LLWLVAGTARIDLAAAAALPPSADEETQARTQLRSTPVGAVPKRVPLIYGTDLFHPHDDPDDHFDLATVFAMPELDVRAILLDLGKRQAEKPGRIPVEQMFKLTGRRVPYAVGLSETLKSPQDQGLDQPEEYQAAVELLLKTLRDSPEPMILHTTGSVRDVCAAYNRDPELFRRKVTRLYVNIGNLLENKNEWNVHLDVPAYVGLMRSGLPIYWCPCLPIKENRSTHWAFKHGQVLEGVPLPLLNYFVYALQTVRPNEIDPIDAMNMDLRPWRHILMGMERNMWCTGPLIHTAGRTVHRVGDRWVAAASPPPGATPADVFTFVPVRVEISDKGYTKWVENDPKPNMHLYKVTDPKNHEPALKSCLHDLFVRFPVVIQSDLKPD